MADQLKAGKVEFHHINFTGEVEIRRGDARITVSFASLEKLIAEKVRMEAIERLNKMTPPELLALSTKK